MNPFCTLSTLLYEAGQVKVIRVVREGKSESEHVVRE
jgi:hypothetical protein